MEEIESELLRAFSRLSIQASLVGRPPPYNFLHTMGTSRPESPGEDVAFSNILEARIISMI
jgi:hypothetical protein